MSQKKKKKKNPTNQPTKVSNNYQALLRAESLTHQYSAHPGYLLTESHAIQVREQHFKPVQENSH